MASLAQDEDLGYKSHRRLFKEHAKFFSKRRQRVIYETSRAVSTAQLKSMCLSSPVDLGKTLKIKPVLELFLTPVGF